MRLGRRAGCRAGGATRTRLSSTAGKIVYTACNNCHNIYWIGDEQRGRTIP